MRSSNNDTTNMDLEALPNYTLVSGLPTYDDALEQLRLSSTNHLLINHQTLMKLFGTTTTEKQEKSRLDSPLPSYEDSMDTFSPPKANDSTCVPQIIDLNEPNVDTHRPPVHHRFKCTIVPQQIGIEPIVEANRNNNLSDVSTSVRARKPNPFVIGNNQSLGSLNIVKEIKNSKPEVPWIHGSVASLCLDYSDSATKYLSKNEHRTSLY